MILDRRQPPVANPVQPFQIPEPNILKTSLGTPVVKLDFPGSEIVYTELIFGSGRWWEVPFGVSYFTSKMLLEGTQTRSSEAIARQFESLGSHIQISPGMDYVSVKLYALKKHFQKSLDLLFDILLEPTFPEKEYETLREIRLHEIRSQLARNSYFATVNFLEALFGAEHPYGVLPDIEKIQNIQLSQVRSYHQRQLFNRPCGLILGSLNQELNDFMHRLDSLPNASATPRVLEEGPESPGTRHLEREKSSQASIRVGAKSITRSHQDVHRLAIANLLLGGFFGSRLMKNVREDKGLTYGISSQITHLRHGSYFQISAEVERSKAHQALEEIEKEIAALQHSPPSTAELQTAISYARGKFLSSLDSPLSLASLQKNEVLNERVGYYNSFINTLENISPEEICEVANKYLQTSTQVVVS